MRNLASTTERDVTHYLNQGYVTLPIFTRNELQAFRVVMERVVDRHAQKLQEKGEISDLHAGASFERRLALLHSAKDPGFRAWNSVAFSSELHELITHPRLVSVLETLLGPEIIFQGDYHLRPKLPNSKAGALPWHQDSQYFGEPTKALHIVTVSVALVDVNEENGCIWVAPGSNAWGFWAGAIGPEMNTRVVAHARETGQPVLPCSMDAGSALFMSNLTFHSSFENRSNGIRWTIDLRYSAPDHSRTLSPAERDGYAHRFKVLESLGYSPFVVKSELRPATSWDVWHAQHMARNKNDLSRMDRFA